MLSLSWQKGQDCVSVMVNSGGDLHSSREYVCYRMVYDPISQHDIGDCAIIIILYSVPKMLNTEKTCV